MKKTLAIILSAIICTSFSACGNNNVSESSSSSQISSSQSTVISSSSHEQSSSKDEQSSTEQSSQQNSDNSEVIMEKPIEIKEYAELIKSIRSDEINNAFEIIGSIAGEEPSFLHNPNNVKAEEQKGQIDLSMEVLGIDKEMSQSYAYSVSLMNVQAYAVGVFMPNDGKASDIENALNEYVKSTQKSFEQYLQDKYEIAKNAIVKTLSSGEVIIVMCENSDKVAESIEKELAI